MASKVSKGTVVDSTSAYLAAEAQKHLPSVDVVGTFSYGKRVTTPSGKPMIPIRPASALAARVRGVSAGAEEARPQRDILLERSRNTKPNESAVRDVEVWIATAQQDAKRLPPGVVSPRIEGSLVEAQAVATPHMLRHRWRSRLLSTVRNRALYPSATVLLPDVAQRGPLDRLATLLHAAGQFKLKVDAGTPPTLVIPATVNAKASVVTADTAEVLFGSNLRIQGGSDVIVGSDMNARHVVLAVGTHFYQLDLLHPSGELLCATEIKARIVAAVEHAACSPHPHEFLGRLSAVSRSDKAVLEDITTSLSSACLANQRSLRALNSAWLVVSLLPDADADDTLVVPPTSAAWTGASLQLVMHPSGVSSLTANTMFVDTTTLLVFAQHISHAANTDPMLSAPLAPVPHDVAAMKRVPLSQVRPTTAGKPGAKGAAAVAVVAQSDDGNLDETATVLEVSIPAPPRAQVLIPLPLWLPVSLASTILAVGLQNPVATSCFEVPVTFSGVMEVACILAVDAALRSEGDDLPPLVRVARSTATSCPDEVTVFSDAVHNALNVLKPLLRGAKDRSVDEFLFKRDRRQVQSALRAAIAATSSAICASSSERTAAIGVGQLLPVARTLSSSGYLPGAPSLRHRGEACAPADVLVFHHTLTPSHHGLTSVVERSSLGPESARFSLSYCETHEAGTWSCVLSHRRDDQRTASAYVDAAMTAYSAIQRILLGDP